MTKVPHNPNEIIAVVNDKNNVIGKATRVEAHKKGLLHREVYVYFINSKKQILLQKRKDNGLWDHSSAGHFPYNQEYIEAAQREFEEELGIILDKSEFQELTDEKLKTEKKNGINYRFAKIFLVKKDFDIGDFNVDHEEIEKVKFFDKKELQEILNAPEKVMTGSSKNIIMNYFLKELD